MIRLFSRRPTVDDLFTSSAQLLCCFKHNISSFLADVCTDLEWKLYRRLPMVTTYATRSIDPRYRGEVQRGPRDIPRVSISTFQGNRSKSRLDKPLINGRSSLVHFLSRVIRKNGFRLTEGARETLASVSGNALQRSLSLHKAASSYDLIRWML